MEAVNIRIGADYNLVPSQVIHIKCREVFVSLSLYLNATAQNLYPGVPVVAIALTAESKGETVSQPVTPCGMCRQVISETQKRYKSGIRILMLSKTEAIIANSIEELLPLAFI